MTASAQATTDEATGAPSFEDVRRLLEEYGVEIVSKSAHLRPGQTRAPETINRIWRRHGEDHIRLVLSTLAETANNHACLDEATLWAVSDLVRACRTIIEDDAGAWLELFDAIPIGQLQEMCSDLSGISPVRAALVGAIYERIVRRFGKGAAQPDLFDDRGPYGETD